jgi:hypothetical protein
VVANCSGIKDFKKYCGGDCAFAIIVRGTGGCADENAKRIVTRILTIRGMRKSSLTSCIEISFEKNLTAAFERRRRRVWEIDALELT